MEIVIIVGAVAVAVAGVPAPPAGKDIHTVIIFAPPGPSVVRPREITG